MGDCEHRFAPGEYCGICEKEKSERSPVERPGYVHSPIGEMHKEFERIISSSLNWPIERTGSRYHDEKTAGAWIVFRRGEGA